MKVVCYNYDYAGFKYDILFDGCNYTAKPLEGQHKAAYKDRHIRNAVIQYKEELF